MKPLHFLNFTMPNFFDFMMLAKYLKLVTFASEAILNLDYLKSVVARIFLEPIERLTEKIHYKEMTPLMIVA
jgi:hypothetical protein